MSMTREEAIKRIDEQYKICEDFYYLSANPEKDFPSVISYMEALAIAISALRPVSREMVEKVWRGEWISYLDGEHIMPERYYSCSKCGDRGYTSKRNFCDSCGAPMTDEAVDMVMERMETIR